MTTSLYFYINNARNRRQTVNIAVKEIDGLIIGEDSEQEWSRYEQYQLYIDSMEEDETE